MLGRSKRPTMRAATFHGRHDLRVRNLEIPRPGPGELLLEVRSSGICGTDALEWDRGPVLVPLQSAHPSSGHFGPTVLGHEFGGRVAEIGSRVEGFSVGETVACVAAVTCGRCVPCQGGTPNHCDSYFTLGFEDNGGLAQYVTVPAAACLEVGSLGLGDDEAALVQPMSIARHALGRGDPGAGDTVVIAGVGGVGVFLVFAAARMGTQVVAIDRDQGRLDIAAAMGATTLRARAQDEHLADRVRALADDPISVLYEVTGSPKVLSSLLGVVRPRGRAVVVSLCAEPVTIDMRLVTLRELQLVGSRTQVFATDFVEAAALIASRPEGWNDVAPVAIPLDELVAAGLRPISRGSATNIKTLVDPWATTARPACVRASAIISPDRASQKNG